MVARLSRLCRAAAVYPIKGTPYGISVTASCRGAQRVRGAGARERCRGARRGRTCASVRAHRHCTESVCVGRTIEYTAGEDCVHTQNTLTVITRNRPRHGERVCVALHSDDPL